MSASTGIAIQLTNGIRCRLNQSVLCARRYNASSDASVIPSNESGTHSVIAIFVGFEPSSAVWVIPVRVLGVIQAVVVRLPSLYRAVGDRLARKIEDSAFTEHVFALAFRSDGAALRNLRKTIPSDLTSAVVRNCHELTSAASSVKKGPRTVASVAGGLVGWFIESTSAERPRASERRINSCRVGEQIWPTSVKNLMAVLRAGAARGSATAPTGKKDYTAGGKRTSTRLSSS